MRQRRLGVVTPRLAVHECRRTEGGLAHEIGFEDVTDATVNDPVARAQSHEQVVRVLIVDERPPLKVLACLKYLRRAERVHGERFERHHAVQGQLATANPPLSGEHEPVLRFPDREVGEFPVLIVVAEDHVRVASPRPRVLRRFRAGTGMLMLEGRCFLRERCARRGNQRENDDET